MSAPVSARTIFAYYQLCTYCYKEVHSLINSSLRYLHISTNTISVQTDYSSLFYYSHVIRFELMCYQFDLYVLSHLTS